MRASLLYSFPMGSRTTGLLNRFYMAQSVTWIITSSPFRAHLAQSTEEEQLSQQCSVCDLGFAFCPHQVSPVRD